ncbi:hypothetical protein DL96DRAFT_1713148 [Flagelloscypha sp. PMI_526]|nr:hypothetical protein DL96DRAFT_1713148 [Flagelloscypha sp. PMI_526]
MPSNVEIIRGMYEDMITNPTGESVEKSPYLSDAFKCTTLPATVGWPEMDKTAYIEQIKMGYKMTASRKIVLGDIIDAGDKVIAQATTHMTLPDEPEIVLLNLCIFTFEGGKIVHVKQFLDSLVMAKLAEKFKPQA